MNDEEKLLWQEIASLTYEKCQETCPSLGGCCHGMYCEMAAEFMKNSGETPPPMPFVVNGRCIIPPHYRPLCSLHQCKMHGMGEDDKDLEWTKKYYELRDKLEELNSMK